MEKIENQSHHNASIQACSSSKVGLKFFKMVEKAKVQQSYIPFLFKNKEAKLQKNNTNPSPGQYDCKSDFLQKDKRDQLIEKYNLVMQNSKKIKQSMIFKSVTKRFNYKEQIDKKPLSYSSNTKRQSQNIFQVRTFLSEARKFKQIFHKSMTSLKQKQKCPSIPDSSLQFGYTLTKGGRLQKISKTMDQLFKQKQSMKQYVKKLGCQKTYPIKSFYKNEQKGLTLNVQNIKKKISDEVNINQISKSIVKDSQKKKKENNKKPLLVSNAKCDSLKIKKLIQQKKMVSDSLGPGSYQVLNYSLGNQLKPQKFQFFSSTSQRFSIKKQTQNQLSQDAIKKLQAQNRIYQLKKSKQLNIWKGLKKPQKAQKNIQKQGNKQNLLPGPADYNPNPNLIKSKLGKISPFDRSVRFDLISNEKKQRGEQNSFKKSWQKSKFFSTSECTENKPMKYNELMQKNKQFLRNKKQKIEQTYKKYKTRGQSQYSICSWQSRPFSRNQCIPSVLKQSQKQQI